MSNFWHLGKFLNRYPSKEEFKAKDISETNLKGWIPQSPFLTKSQHFTGFGSCFATTILEHLQQLGFNIGATGRDDIKIPVIHFFEIFTNTYSVLQLLEWALSDKILKMPIYKRETEIVLNETSRNETKNKLKDTDVFIITFGLSEAWRNIEFDEYLSSSVPTSIYTPEKYEFRIISAQENFLNLVKIHKIIRENCKRTATIIWTLSPIPLIATFREVSCITANQISKASLRSSIDQAYRELSDDNLFYFPAYEIVQAFDSFDDSGRYLKKDIRDLVMSTFSRFYLKT